MRGIAASVADAGGAPSKSRTCGGIWSAAAHNRQIEGISPLNHGMCDGGIESAPHIYVFEGSGHTETKGGVSCILIFRVPIV